MNTANLSDNIQHIADMVGFDLETQTWVAEPEELYNMLPELPLALVALFTHFPKTSA